MTKEKLKNPLDNADNGGILRTYANNTHGDRRWEKDKKPATLVEPALGLEHICVPNAMPPSYLRPKANNLKTPKSFAM